MKQVYTNVFVRRQLKEVLLGYKTRGFGVGLWNGFGGKVEEGESVVQAAHRELFEESNLQSDHLERAGIVTFVHDDTNRENVVHIFKTDAFNGEEQASEEMDPLRWFPCTQLPFEQMWPDIKIWFPHLFDNAGCFITNVQYVHKTMKSFRTRILDRDEFEKIVG